MLNRYSHSGLLEAREQERHFGGAKNILGDEHMRRDNFDFRLTVGRQHLGNWDIILLGVA
jgi:hypothetical protein